MSRHLPLVCPSNEGPKSLGLTSEPCTRAACTWWKDGCTAGAQTTKDYARWFKGELPACPIAEQCTWNVDAVKRGEPGCAPRRLGLLCEHQGGEWNTFDMADPDDEEAWGAAIETP